MLFLLAIAKIIHHDRNERLGSIDSQRLPLSLDVLQDDKLRRSGDHLRAEKFM